MNEQVSEGKVPKHSDAAGQLPYTSKTNREDVRYAASQHTAVLPQWHPEKVILL